MSSQEQYVTITHYKEREFYFLNYAIQTEDGFIPKEIEQFHESDKTKFIERIRMLQSQHPNNQIVSISLNAKQTISEEEDRNKASAEIFKHNYVIQENIDVGDIPTTLYFSPFAMLYQQYKEGLDNNLKLIIGLFDRKLFMMFATSDKIHQSWIIGTRGLSEKQVADRVYKSMQAYYKISYSFADHLEMLVSDDSPKLLKVLREELSLHITLTQNSIHNLLHGMAGSAEKAKSSYIKSFKRIEHKPRRENLNMQSSDLDDHAEERRVANKNSNSVKSTKENLNDIKLKDSQNRGLFENIKSLFFGESTKSTAPTNPFMAVLPLLVVLAMGGYFSMENGTISDKLSQKKIQITAHKTNTMLVSTSDKVFKAMGKNAELKKAIISTKGVNIKGMVWGIEPLKKSLGEIYSDGKFVIKPLENFMTEFSFTSK
ncbi:MAG: hypothetical protein K0U38_08060 [Epsilonproteobacteria bacterium]|nr:hypothetical protein [Campylobacterota bacterium]